MRISDWSSDVCSSDLHESLPRPDRSPDCLLVTEEILERSLRQRHEEPDLKEKEQSERHRQADNRDQVPGKAAKPAHEGTDEERSGHVDADRSEEHTSELQSLMRISYAVFCLTKKRKNTHNHQ